MIALLIALAAAAQQAAPASDEEAYRSCLSAVRASPAQGVEVASDWRIKGGGISARQCLGLAYVQLERWQAAASEFEQAALDAERERDDRGADLWVQAGNGWLAAADGARARKAFDAALASPSLTAELRGEVHLDRARAGVALADLGGARADLDQGLKLVPQDPFAWYLSAALALREKQVARAQADIAKAVELAPDDADILLQAGTIAGTAGDVEQAKALYARAAKANPASEAGRAAQAALASGAEPAVTPQPR